MIAECHIQFSWRIISTTQCSTNDNTIHVHMIEHWLTLTLIIFVHSTWNIDEENARGREREREQDRERKQPDQVGVVISQFTYTHIYP